MDGWTDGGMGDGQMDGLLVCPSSWSDRRIEDRTGQTDKLYNAHAHRHSRTHSKIKHSWIDTKGWTEERAEERKDAHTST